MVRSSWERSVEGLVWNWLSGFSVEVFMSGRERSESLLVWFRSEPCWGVIIYYYLTRLEDVLWFTFFCLKDCLLEVVESSALGFGVGGFLVGSGVCWVARGPNPFPILELVLVSLYEFVFVPAGLTTTLSLLALSYSGGLFWTFGFGHICTLGFGIARLTFEPSTS